MTCASGPCHCGGATVVFTRGVIRASGSCHCGGATIVFTRGVIRASGPARTH